MPWTIIYYYHDKPIHLDILYKSNPEAQILPLYLKHGLSHHEIWKNSDRVLRNRIIETDMISHILYENILLIEYDVYLNQKMPDMEFESMMTLYSTLNATHWHWWKDVDALPEQFKSYAIAGPLFCAIAIKKHILSQILDPKYNSFFNLDIMSELRLPTLVRSLGYNPSAFLPTFSKYIKQGIEHPSEMQKFVQTNHKTLKGLFHPVKSRIIYD